MYHIAWTVIEFAARNTAGLTVVALLFAAQVFLEHRGSSRVRFLRGATATLSVFWIGALVAVFMNHIRFPLFLESLEGTVFQHFQRAAHLQPIYLAPTPEFVPFAYNPLYYFFSVPFSWIFGERLFTLRLVSIVATIGIGALILLILKRGTGSAWWGLTGAGLFAASYQVMDSHLDSAHADACLMLCSLAGSAIIHFKKSRGMRLLGLGLLISAFWFKQHGAMFAIGGLAYLTWDEGWRRSWPYWVCGLLLGPVTYVALGPVLFGSHFLYFTYTAPSGWSSLSASSFARGAELFSTAYCWLSLASAWWFARHLRQRASGLTIWEVQLVAAVATAVIGSMDDGSSNNVYIPLATWLVLYGVWGLSRMEAALDARWRVIVPAALVVVSFALVAFNPLEVMRSRQADLDYREFVRFLHSLDGNVYAPSLGQLPDDYSFYPAAHWVALEDMVRGPNKDTRNQPVIRKALAPLLNSERPVYILDNYPLTTFPCLDYLNEYFVLEEDLQNRFRSLRVVPGRWDLKWPRYLYRFDPDLASRTGDRNDEPENVARSPVEPPHDVTSESDSLGREARR